MASFLGDGPNGTGDHSIFNRPSPFNRYRKMLYTRYCKFIDDSTPHIAPRWIATAVVLLLYTVRVYFLGGWHIISYALGIYILNLLIGFLSPAVDPEFEGPALPVKTDDEFRPFVRRLPEFKFWYATTKALFIAILCTFVSFLNIPVFWPILLIYFIALFAVTMRKQIRHMMQYNYVPFTTGKKRYRGKVGDKKADLAKRYEALLHARDHPDDARELETQAEPARSVSSVSPPRGLVSSSSPHLDPF